MGLFDFFSKNKSPGSQKPGGKELARLERLVSSKLSQNFDRQEAIEELSRMATPESAAVLLKRFDWSLDPSITDQEEKEACVQGITAAGEAALEPLREYGKRAESLTWPLKVLKAVVPNQRMAEELLGLLDLFDTEYVRNVVPKVQLLSALSDHASDEVRVAVEPFLNDASEPVRFTAATTVFAIGNADSIPALIAQLEAEESLRVRNRIAQGFTDRTWSIPEELRKSCAQALPEGFRLVGETVKGEG